MTSPSASRLFRDLARLHVRAQRAAIRCGATSETHCTLITEVGRSEPISMSDLVTRLELDKSWVSRAVEQLVQEGLVERIARESDRRVAVVSLTPAGRRKFKEVEACLDAQIGRVFARLKTADRGKVAAALTLLHDAYLADAVERASARTSPAAA